MDDEAQKGHQMKLGPIVGDGGASRFDLRREPDGVYLCDGRAIPARHNTAGRVYDSQSVVSVHHRADARERLLSAKLGVDVGDK